MSRIFNLAFLAGVTTVGLSAPIAADPEAAVAAAPQMSTSLGVYVFPAKGQSAATQRTDEANCFAWAKTQTGFDPLAPAAPPTAAAPATQAPAQPAANPAANAPARGAVGGAAAGAAIGAIAGNAGKGAAIGATAGVLSGAAAKNQGAKAAQQQQAQATAQQQAAAQQQTAQQLATAKAGYNKAFSACLEGKGYTVK
jgi:hypothetical protein